MKKTLNIYLFASAIAIAIGAGIICTSGIAEAQPCDCPSIPGCYPRC